MEGSKVEGRMDHPDEDDDEINDDDDDDDR